MEMSRDQLERKLINIGGDGTYEKIRDDEAPLYIMDDASITLDEICSVAREYKAKHNMWIIFSLYILLLRGSLE